MDGARVGYLPGCTYSVYRLHNGCMHFTLRKGLFRAGIPNFSLLSLAMPLLEHESAA